MTENPDQTNDQAEQPPFPVESSLLRPLPAAETSPKGGSPTVQKSKIGIKLNVPLLAGTVLVLAALGTTAYFWHSFQTRKTAGTFLVRADQLEAEENWSAAAEYIYRYLLVHPKDAEARVRLAETYDRSVRDAGRLPRAINLYYRALGVASPENATALRVRVAELNLELGAVEPLRFTAAEEEARALLEANENDPVAHRLLALALLGQQQTKTSELDSGDVIGEEMEKAWRLNQGDVQISLALAGAYRDGLRLLTPEQLSTPPAERAERADRIIDALVQANPENPEAYLARFGYRQYYKLGAADADLEAALTHGPDNVSVRWFAAGHALRKAMDEDASPDDASKQLQEAQDHFEFLASDKRPPTAPAYRGLAEVHSMRGDVDRAIEVLRRGLAAVGQDNIELNAHLASVLVAAGRLEEAATALSAFEGAVASQKSTMSKTERFTVERTSNLLRGHWLARKGEHQAVIPLLEDVVLQQEGSEFGSLHRYRAWLLMGESHSALRQWSYATAAFREAAKIRPNSIEPLRAEVAVWTAAGSWEKAIDLYERVLVLEDSPDNRLALAHARLQYQIQLPREKRNWERFSQVLSNLKNGQTETHLTDPWRVAMLEARYTILRAEERELQEPGQRAQGIADALEMLRRTEALYPKSHDLFRGLALFYESLGAQKDADRAAGLYENLEGGSTEAYLLHAGLYSRRGRYEESRRILVDGLDKVSSESSLPLKLGLIRINVLEGNGEQAYQDLIQLREAYPSNVGLLSLLAEIALQTRRFNELVDYETELRKLEGPKGQHWRYYEARRLLVQATGTKDARFARADKLSSELQLDQPEWSGTHLLNGLILHSRGDLASAIEAYEDAIRAGDRRILVYQRLISLLYSANRLEEADGYISELESRGLFNQSITSLQISIAERQGQYDRAIEIARQEVDRRPNDALAKAQLAQTLTRRGHIGNTELAAAAARELEEALHEATLVAQTYAEDAERKAHVLLQIANVRATQHRNADAIKLYRNVLQLAPTSVTALNNLATLLAESEGSESRKEARELIDRAIAIVGTQPAFLDTKGMSFYHDQNAAKAVECLEEAAAGPNADPRYFFHLALTYELLGQRNESLVAFKRAQDSGLENTILTKTDRRLLMMLEETFGNE